MSQNNFRSVFTAVAIAASAPILQYIESDSRNNPLKDLLTYQQPYESGPLRVLYPRSTDHYIITQHEEKRIERESLEMQDRFLAMKHSFMRYRKDISSDELSYFTSVANVLCKLDFKDNISSYNESDKCIDTVLRLSNGLTLSISSFLDEDINAPMVFSIHRGRMLLVTDEMPISEIVKTINSVVS